MVKFYLDKKKGHESPILLSLLHQGERIKVFTGKKIHAHHWDVKTCRANPKKYKNNSVGFNQFLQGISDDVEKLLNDNKPISKGHIENIIDKASGRETNDTFFGFAKSYLLQQIAKGYMLPQSAKAYQGTLNHLEKINKKLDFQDINLNFYDKFVTHLRDGGKAVNSIGGHVKRLKWFMEAALDRDLHTNVTFKKKAFKATTEETDQIYLTRKEINQLSKKTLEPRLKKVADAFIVNCYLGQRYSDWAQMQKGNFKKEKQGLFHWSLVQDKTNEKISVPVPNECLSILKKYNFTCPIINGLGKLMSPQKFNKYLKEAAKVAELNAIEDIRLNGEVKKMSKHELIKSHTARRSFATNLYLEGVPIQNIMAITGHRKEETFLLYVRADQLTKSKGLAQHYQRASKPIMKVTKGGKAA